MTHFCCRCGTARVWITRAELTPGERTAPSVFHCVGGRLQIVEIPSARVWCLGCWRKHKDET